MSESDTSVATEKNVPRPRSVIEKTIVWGGILILLGVVLVEWTSMRDFAATLEDLESAFHSGQSGKDAKPFTEADVNGHVHGFAFKSEIKQEKTGQRTFQWPSIFKFYKLGVSFNEDGRVFVVDTFNVPAGS